MQNLIDRFNKKINKTSSGCWEWQGWKNHDGYGFFRYLNKKEIQAHRFSAKHLAGLDIDNKVVCHRCDNPGCVNPDHLFVGTQLDNIQDRHVKQRNFAYKIRTPLGVFPSQVAAAKAHEVDPAIIGKRLRIDSSNYVRV